MRFTLRVPFIGREFVDFRVTEWLVEEGAELTPGTDVCVLRAVTRQRVERWAKKSRFRRRKDGADPVEEMKIRHSPPLMTVTAGENGILLEVLEPAGSMVRQGVPIGRIASADNGEDDGDGGEFHAVANMTGIDHEGAG